MYFLKLSFFNLLLKSAYLNCFHEKCNKDDQKGMIFAISELQKHIFILFKEKDSWKLYSIKGILEEKIALHAYTRLKNNAENNSTWDGAFYQSEWVKINSLSWDILVFSRYVCCC